MKKVTTLVGQLLKKKPLIGSSNPKAKRVRTPHDYQKRGVEWLVSHGGAGLFADPGTGKTGITLFAFAVLKRLKIARRALVVAPLRVAYEVWPAEPAEWIGSEWDEVKDLKIVVLHGPKKDELAKQDADIYVINFDGLKWLFEGGAYNRFNAMGIDTLVVDESSKVKNTRTKRFKFFKPILGKFARRWILTGSPNPNGYMDLFGQIYIIDLGRSLGRFITHYRMQYFTALDRMGWQWALKSGAEALIQQAVAPYIFRLDAEDYLKLPQIIPNTVRIELPVAARKIYDDLEEQMFAELEDGKVITAANTGAAYTKCAQVANGGLYHMQEGKFEGEVNKRRTWVNLHSEKVDAVEELVEELNGAPCMVVYDFEHDLARLQERFKHAEHIGGDVGAKESKRIIAAWNNDEISILLVQPQTVSHGLNMQYGSAQHIIWHSLTYDFEVYDQLIKRIRRQGSRHKRVFIHHIVATGTVDEPKLRALRQKDKTQRGFLAAMKEYAREKQA